MATVEGTEKYFKKFEGDISTESIRTLGKSGLKVSNIGFGGYRVHFSIKEHAKALREALHKGVNLIDTSSNYTDGGSELLVGSVLNDLIENNIIERDEIVVVSKAGYIQGQNMNLAQARIKQNEPYPEVVEYDPQCWHCIHPEFLEEQLRLSLSRFRLEHIDVYLLHNPEYFLSDDKNKDVEMKLLREQYYRRIKDAFTWMEEKVKEGKITCYGISSNTFPNPRDYYAFTSLEEVIKIAEEISADNHFSVIQFPFNLLEDGIMTEKNQNGGRKTTLEVAIENNLGTLVNRPLNALKKKGMVRFVSFRSSDMDSLKKSFGSALENLTKAEKKYSEVIEPLIPEDFPKNKITPVLSMTRQMFNALNMFEGWMHWDHVKQNVIVPQSVSVIGALDQKLSGKKEWDDWSQEYSIAFLNFIETVTIYYETKEQVNSKKRIDKLDELSVSLRYLDTLSNKSVKALSSVPGISTVLVGMRKQPYVDDMLGVMSGPDVPDAENVILQFEE